MIFGDRIQLQQVALNLLVNAIDAMGTLQSSVREIRINSAKSSASGVMITIEDTGGGIDPGFVRHLFDAFHSTKSDGMGIGLSIWPLNIKGAQIYGRKFRSRTATGFRATVEGRRRVELCRSSRPSERDAIHNTST